MGARGEGDWTEALEVHLEAAVMEVGSLAAWAPVGALPAMKALMELEVDKLGEAGWALLALVGPLS